MKSVFDKLFHPSHEWKDIFVFGERAGLCLPLIFWERQVKEIRFLLHSLLEHGPSSAQPTHWAHGSFTTAVEEKERTEYRCLRTAQ